MTILKGILYFDIGPILDFTYEIMRIYGLIIIMLRRACVLLMFFPELTKTHWVCFRFHI